MGSGSDSGCQGGAKSSSVSLPFSFVSQSLLLWWRHKVNRLINLSYFFTLKLIPKERYSTYNSLPVLANAQSGSLSQQQQQGNLNNNNNNKNNGEKKGIQCYMCNSVHDPHCGDPFDPSTIEKVDCEQFKPNATVCRKNVQKGTYNQIK